jgi:hypothetical protein
MTGTNTCIVSIGLTGRKMKAINNVLAVSESGKKTMFPIFTHRGETASLRKQTHRVVDKVFDQFEGRLKNEGSKKMLPIHLDRCFWGRIKRR